MTTYTAKIKSISFYTETRDNNFFNDEELNKELQADFLNRCYSIDVLEGFGYSIPKIKSPFPELLETQSDYIVKDVVFEVDGLSKEVVETDDWKPMVFPPHPKTGKQVPNYPDDFRFIQKVVFQPKEEN